ncbi:MAG: aromatic ring-hydroxylating dioxygenase subunit alpha [Hyphomicrobium sp.]|jgi:Rieske 2Fe-2S family protein
MQISSDLRSMILRRKQGHSLEAPFYISKEVFDLDMQAIFGRHWIYVGVEPDILEPGDYFTVQLGRASVVVVRDDDMSIRAFYNVCRHRGAQLCDGLKGSVGNIVCPYHQWTYDLTGKLIYSEHMGDSFDHSQYSLKTVHVGNIAGLIFICLADQPPADFEDLRRAMEPYILPHNIRNCKVAYEEDLIENGNWKLTMENNRECYHCKANHPELTVSLYEFGFGYRPSPENEGQVKAFHDLIKTEHARWESCGLPSVEREFLDTRVTAYRTERLPLDKAGESQTISSKVACQKLLGELTQRNLGGLSFWTQPNSWHHFMSDHIVTFSVLPIDPEHTLLRTKWLVHKDAVEGRDYDPKELSEVWHATNRQDGALVERTHLGAVSPAYQPGPYSQYTEEFVEKFLSWYIQRLRAVTGIGSGATVSSLTASG